MYHLRTSLCGASAPPLVGPTAEKVAACLLSWQEVGHALLLAFVVMPDHLHVLAVLLGSRPLEQSFGRWKNWSAREINKDLGRRGPIWQPGFFDRRIRREDDVVAVGGYIEDNPVRKELAPSAEDFLYSSASTRFSPRMLGRQWLATGAVA
ncbi:MAG: transposase [Pseudomonadota bacterium]